MGLAGMGGIGSEKVTEPIPQIGVLQRSGGIGSVDKTEPMPREQGGKK